jgi:hypoxanthine-guanine phosphoribosyltransferase
MSKYILSDNRPVWVDSNPSNVELERIKIVDVEITTSYLDEVLYPTRLANTITRAAVKIKKHIDIKGFQAIAFRGMSGALFAPILARSLKKYLIMVRKSSYSHHSPYPVEGLVSPCNYLIIDDQISSGHTILEIQKMIYKYANKESKLIGLYTYRNDMFISVESLKRDKYLWKPTL